MNEETGHRDFESLLGSLTPVTPCVSTASVLFEAGRRRGAEERIALRESAQGRRLRYWQFATVVSLLGMVLSVAVHFQTGNRSFPNSPAENSGIASNEGSRSAGEKTPVDQPAGKAEAIVSSEETLVPDHSSRDPVHLVGGAGKGKSAFFGIPGLYSTIDPGSGLARRQRALRFGVDGLPELEELSPLLVHRPVSRRVLLEQMTEGKEF